MALEVRSWFSPLLLEARNKEQEARSRESGVRIFECGPLPLGEIALLCARLVGVGGQVGLWAGVMVFNLFDVVEKWWLSVRAMRTKIATDFTDWHRFLVLEG